MALDGELSKQWEQYRFSTTIFRGRGKMLLEAQLLQRRRFRQAVQGATERERRLAVQIPDPHATLTRHSMASFQARTS